MFSLSLSLCLQSLKDGVAISEKERRPEDGRSGGGSTDVVWCRTRRSSDGDWTAPQQRTMLRPMSDRPRPHHQSRRPLQILSPARLQSLSRVQHAAQHLHRQHRLGLHRLLQNSVSISRTGCPLIHGELVVLSVQTSSISRCVGGALRMSEHRAPRNKTQKVLKKKKKQEQG